jgi:RNA polymerase sigma-70 factor (ECF subfamily)
MGHPRRPSGSYLAEARGLRSENEPVMMSAGATRSTTTPIESAAPTLLRRLSGGDQSALGEFYDLYAGLVNGIALRILRDATEAEDVVQEVFVQIWRQAARYDPGRGTPEAWICTMTRTRALDRLRRRAARREEPGEAAPGASAAPKAEEALAVRKALDGLSADQRHALELAYYEGLTQSEIAKRLDEPLGTVKTRIRAAMIRLREALEPLT